MPLPLLAIPFVAAASSGAGISAGALVGSIFGSFGGGIVLTTIANWIHKKFNVSDGHEKSLNKQSEIRQENNNVISKGLTDLSTNANQASTSIQTVTTSNNEVVNQLGALIKELQSSTNTMPEVIKLLNTFKEALTISENTRAPEFISSIQSTMVIIQEFTTLIMAKDSLIKDVSDKIQAQQTLMQVQNELIEQLEAVIKDLTIKNQQLEQTVSKHKQVAASNIKSLQKASEYIKFFSKSFQNNSTNQNTSSNHANQLNTN